MDAVRADDEIVAASRAVGEADPRRSAVFELRHRCAEPNRDLCDRLTQRLVQCRSMDRHAAADAVPKTVDVDVGKQTAAVVEEALPPDRVRARRQSRSDAELIQCPYGVSRQIQAGAGRLPFGHPLNDLDVDVALIQSAGQRETGNTGTDDQHAHAVTSALLSGSHAQPRACARSRPCRRPSRPSCPPR